MSGNDERNENIFWCCAGLTLVTAIGFGGVGIYKVIKHYHGQDSSHMIPLDINVKEGFVKPSKLDVILKDVDKDGKNETVIKHQNVEYLLRTDASGKLYLSRFSVEPAKFLEYAR